MSDKSDNKDELLALIVSDSDEITTIETDEEFMYIPDFMDDETTDEEFENSLNTEKGIRVMVGVLLRNISYLRL